MRLASAAALLLFAPLSIATSADEPAETPVTRQAVCRWTDTPPVIDGKLDERAWARADLINQFSAYWKKARTGNGTQARLLWDNDALYFSARMTDAELRSFGTRRNDHLWEGDVIEIFFRPDASKPEYYEFQANPKSLVLELAWPSRGLDFDKIAAGPPLGMTAVAVVDGTLDQPGDKDRGWSVEGKIPWTAFALTGGRPKPGAVWRFTLCRYDYGPEGTQPVLMSASPLTQPSFHRYEDYGRLLFEGPVAR